ncbi:sugar ABC transporter substrate-binding protein [Sharpea azabuensis]|uniref:Sugar ABC transporter substrate-binding protein n=1 Tax=Sharpea porci TaxID=2652286 RepID=A0A844FT51_9FIRM|nr:substrate-binding domain-containing protein [Sharpea porci]MST88815.1 sugar ABC transporter substrate-binding protein [Sharpea porci]
MHIRSKIVWMIIFLSTSLIIYTVYTFSNITERSIVIGTTYMTMNNTFYEAINSEVKKIASQNNCKLVVRDPELDVNKQIRQINAMREEGVNAIIINPVEGNNKHLIEALKKAKQDGIYIVVVDSQLSDSQFVDSTIVSDNYHAGVICAQDLMKRRTQAKVLLLTHNSANSAVDRINGFTNTIKAHPEYQIVDRIDVLGQTEIAMPKVSQYIDEHRNFDVIMSLNDPAALGSLAALEEKHLNRDMLIYSVDGSPNMKKFISDKANHVITAVQSPEGMARQSVHTVLQLIKGKQTKKTIKLNVDQLISKDNINEYNILGWQ